MRSTTRRWAAAINTAVMAIGGAVTAGAADAESAESTESTGATTAALQAVTVRPDPSYQGQPFEGWGTSLVWFANVTGGYLTNPGRTATVSITSEDGSQSRTYRIELPQH